MALSTAQIATLKTFVSTSVDANIIAARTGGNTFLLAQLLSAVATPATSSWRNNVPAKELDAAVTYTTYDALTSGKRDEWSIFLAYAPRDMSFGKNRNVVTDVWGAATAASISEAALLASVENANVAEVALGGTTVATGTVSALKRNYVGPVTQSECVAILAP